MIVPWNDEKCIVCRLTTEERRTRCAGTAEFTKEHLIPDAIGGKLQCSFLCKHCNDHLGEGESDLKSDARIRLAIENLKGVLPNLWATMSEGQRYIVQDSAGTLGAKLKNGKIRFDSGQDGSFLLDIDEAWTAIHKKLLRPQSAQAQIDHAKRRFEEITEGVKAEVVPGMDVLKRGGGEVYLRLELAETDIALLKVAYEFLVLHLGRGIFNDYFDPVRSTFASGAALPACCRVEPFGSRDRRYQAFHSLRATNTHTGLLVKIILFGYLSYHVEFRKVSLPSDAIWDYTLNLVTGHEEWS
jgi:hypothetical protein